MFAFERARKKEKKRITFPETKQTYYNTLVINHSLHLILHPAAALKQHGSLYSPPRVRPFIHSRLAPTTDLPLISQSIDQPSQSVLVVALHT